MGSSSPKNSDLLKEIVENQRVMVEMQASIGRIDERTRMILDALKAYDERLRWQERRTAIGDYIIGIMSVIAGILGLSR